MVIWTQMTYQDKNPEPLFQFSQTGPHFLQ